MNKKYEKPTAKDLNEVTMADGACQSGGGVPNRCVSNGYNNAGTCITSGNTVGQGANPSCSPAGMLAISCSFGTGAA